MQFSVFGNKRSELHFLDIEGLYVLLDLAENCEQCLKRITVSSICTILENPKSFQYFVEWSSSKTSINASQMLIKLFQDEDHRFGVVNDNGVLQNAERPLNPNDSYNARKTAYEEAAQSIVSDSAANKSLQSPLHLVDNQMDVSQRVMMQSQSSANKLRSKTQKSLS